MTHLGKRNITGDMGHYSSMSCLRMDSGHHPTHNHRYAEPYIHSHAKIATQDVPCAQSQYTLSFVYAHCPAKGNVQVQLQASKCLATHIITSQPSTRRKGDENRNMLTHVHVLAHLHHKCMSWHTYTNGILFKVDNECRGDKSWHRKYLNRENVEGVCDS